MANGYLGKISAIVTANTADFQAKLGDAAGGVRKFSREVQSSITKSMGDVEKSIQSIYTPLQRLEGSLKAAGSLKLSFQGFAGAIKDVEDLKGRLGELSATQVKIVLDQSGLKSIKEVRSALREVSNRDIRLFDAAGSVRELQKIQAGLDTARGQKKLAKLGIDETELDELIRKLQRFPAQRIKAVIDVLGKDMLDSSFDRAQKLFSLSQQINKPLEAAIQSFTGLSREVQAGFIPTLGRAQNEAQSLADDIKRGCDIGQSRFEAVEDSVNGVTIAIKQLNEAASLVGNLKTGRELAFEQPGLSSALTRGVKFGGEAESQMAVSGVARANAGDVSTILQKIAAESKRAEAILSNLNNAAAMGLAGWASTLQKDLDQTAASINRLVDEGSQKIDLQVNTGTAKVAVNELEEKLKSLQSLADFTITGNFVNSQQTVAAIQEVIGMMDKLKDSQRSGLQRQLNLLITTATPDSATGVVDLARFKAVYDALKQDIGDGVELNVKTAEADKKLEDLRAKVRGIGEDANFSLSGRVQNSGQAEAEIKRIISGIEKLDAAGKAAVAPKLGAALSSLLATDPNGLPDIAAIRAAVAALKTEFDDQLEIKVTKDKAQKSVEELKSSLAGIADKIGDPSQPIDRLRKSVEAANAAIAKMPAGALKTKLEGDLNAEKIRIEAASKPGAPAPTAAGIDAAAARANAIAAAATAGTPAKAVANSLGADFGTAERSIASLQSKVSSLQGSLEKLPLPMQTQFIPAINKVRDAFQKLTPASTAAEIDAVIKKAGGLERAFTRAEQAAKFGGTLGEALNAAAITKTEKQLGFIRAKLLEVGATASGPVASAFNAYSAAAAAAAKAGVSGTAATTKQLDGLIANIGEALVAEGKLTAAQGKAFSKSVGDVGRAGADKFALALNQAAFAVDDFLSSTGGLEFKLRAISNNVTQLAFILGGTAGLFVGLGAVIAGQAAVGLIKWINNGRSAEDQTKALNESLSRQKSLVEELAQAFRSLGDAVSRGTFSAGGEQAADFSRQVDDIRKKQKESRESRVADIDPAVQRERAEQNKQRKKLESETDIGRRISIQREITASEEREKAAREAAVSRAVSPDEARTRIRGSMERVGIAALGPRRGDDAGRAAAEQSVRDRAEAATAGIPDGATPEVIRAQMAALERQIKALSSTAAEGSTLGFSTSEVARKEVLALEQTLASLEQPLAAAIDKAAIGIAEASRRPASQIRQAQEDVAEAIRRGVPAAAEFQAELDANAKKLRAAGDAIEAAQSETDPTKKQAKVDEANANVAAVEAERADIDRRSRELRLGRTFGGDRTTAALSSLQGNERFRNERAGLTASIESAIDREVAARGRLESATASGVDAEIKAARAELDLAQKASEAAAALAEAAAGIEAALTRIRKVGDSALQRSEQGADAAQRAFEENPLRAGGREARDAAEQRLINDRALLGNAQANLDNRRREIQQNPQMAAINDELEAITQRRKDLEAKSRIGGGLNQAENAELDAATKREIELIRQREMMARQLTEAERKQYDAINNGIVAREKELDALRRKAESDPAFDRRREAAGQIAEGSRRQADEAQQRYINNPTAENKKRRDDADRRAREDRVRADGLQDRLDAKRAEMQSDPRVAVFNKQIEANNERLAALAEKEAKEGLTERELTERARLKTANNAMRGERDRIIDVETRDEQKKIDDAQIAQNQRDRALRGRDLGMTERERRRKEYTEGAGADINARAKEMRDRGEDPSKFLRQALSNQMEAVAPMLKQFQDERQNAILQGPSRAALNVSDVSTSQGASELTRLIRGDDSAKDVNLAELRKQSSFLQDIANSIKENNPEVLL
jgi:hypothetical protein